MIAAVVAVFIVAGGVIASIALLGENPSDHDEPSVCFASSGSPFVQVQIVPRSRTLPCDSPEAAYESVGPPRAAAEAPQPECADGQTAFSTGDGWYCAEPIER